MIRWATDLNIDDKDDDIAWCGLFVAHCVGSTLPEEPLPAGVLGARNWRKFGDHCDPMQGAVLVFWRGDRNGSLGHVGFYRSEDAEAYHVLGGNQSNAVNTTRVGKRPVARRALAAHGGEPARRHDRRNRKREAVAERGVRGLRIPIRLNPKLVAKKNGGLLARRFD